MLVLHFTVDGKPSAYSLHTNHGLFAWFIRNNICIKKVLQIKTPLYETA